MGHAGPIAPYTASAIARGMEGMLVSTPAAANRSINAALVKFPEPWNILTRATEAQREMWRALYS